MAGKGLIFAGLGSGAQLGVLGTDGPTAMTMPHAYAIRAELAPPRKQPNHDAAGDVRSEEHTSELQSRTKIVCRFLLEKKKQNIRITFFCAYV